MKKILIASPTSNHKDYCLEDFIINTRRFTYPADLFLVDNSTDPDYHKKIIDYGVNCVHYKKLAGEPLKRTMAACNNIIRDKALNEGYDYVLSLETDQFPPINFIELLLSFNKKVISLPYFINEGPKSHLLMSVLARKNNKITFEKIPAIEQLKYITGGLTNKIRNNGIGCMLISKEVLKKIEFKATIEDDAYADTHFHISLFQEGIENWLYTGALSIHRNSNWDVILDLETLK